MPRLTANQIVFGGPRSANRAPVGAPVKDTASAYGPTVDVPCPRCGCSLGQALECMRVCLRLHLDFMAARNVAAVIAESGAAGSSRLG